MTEPTVETSGDCTVCGENLLWGGMSWVPHTDEFHAAVKARLKKALVYIMWQKAAVKVGHKVTIRFTADTAWPECTCGLAQTVTPTSRMATSIGKAHLMKQGCEAVYMVLYGPVEGLCRFCRHGWHGGLRCLKHSRTRSIFDGCQCTGEKTP